MKPHLPSPVDKTKRSVSFLKKLIFILVLTPFILFGVYLAIVSRSIINTDPITVDQRFALSSSLKSPYADILKGAFEYSFVFCGDPHMHAEGDGNFPQLDEFIRANRANFAIFGGDLTFLGEEPEYKNFVKHAKALTVSAYPAIGTHELYNNGWEYYWRNLGPSSYAFNGGNARFIVIDTASGAIGTKQMEWIHKELRENKQPLLFVISHEPIYGGSHGIYDFPKTAERTELIAMFEKYKVNYVLEGHYHGYVEVTINGVHYITSGSFSDGLLDSGIRHFLYLRVFGPNVTVQQVPLTGAPVAYNTGNV